MSAMRAANAASGSQGEGPQWAVHVGRGEIVWQDRCDAANGSSEPKAVILQADTSSIRALWLRAPQVRGTQTAALHRFCRSPPDLKPWVNNFLSDLRD
jgi:hypothetical protein